MLQSKRILTAQLAHQLESEFSSFLIKSQCEHEWRDYGHGFKCEKCQHYTGMNEIINMEIRKEIWLRK